MIVSKHPKVLWVFAFGNLWDTFSYYGTQTILALYFMHVFHLSRSTSYLLYGAYATFTFAIPIIGGIIADKWLNAKNTLLLGCLLNIIGNIILFSLHYYWFCFGLACSLIGSGLYKGNAAHLTGNGYQDDLADHKEAGFTWLYLATNVGATLGPVVYGAVIYKLGWNYVFLCSALGMLISITWLIKNWRRIDSTTLLPLRKIIITVSCLLAACILLSLPFYFSSTINEVITAVFASGIIYLLRAIKKYHDVERKHLLALIGLGFFGMFYFAVGLQIGTTITLFIQDNIQSGNLHTHLPASTFSMLYPLFVLLLGPLLITLWRKLKVRGIVISMPIKLAVGIILAAMGITVFMLATITNFVLVGIVLGNLLLSAGELILTPAMYAATSDLSPPGMKSTMMGGWLMFIALGSYFSSVLANASHAIAPYLPLQHTAYFGEFMFIAIFTLLVAVILLAYTPKLLRMIR